VAQRAERLLPTIDVDRAFADTREMMALAAMKTRAERWMAIAEELRGLEAWPTIRYVK
jgi:hypothetical protein